MRLRPDQLAGQLRKGLAPLYLLYGDEPLLVQESADALRAHARRQGFDEREVFTVDAHFDWQRFRDTAASGSLFANHRLLELRLGEAKPGDQGGKALTAYTASPPPDCLLIVTAARLDASTQKTAWFRKLETAGVAIQHWPISIQQLPRWIDERLKSRGLAADGAAIKILVERTEGNLLACAQEIDRLALFYAKGQRLGEQEMQAVANSARYTIFDLTDAALAAKPRRVWRITAGLRQEGVELPLALWSLHREIRTLAALRFAHPSGPPPAPLLQRYGVRDNRKPMVQQALQRLRVSDCRELLISCARVDRVIKGTLLGDGWAEMLHLALQLAGQPLPGLPSLGTWELSHHR